MKLRQTLVLLAALMAISTGTWAAKIDSSGFPWWWNHQWWEQGRIEVPINYAVKTRWLSYKNGDTEIRALLARPKKPGKYPAILFQHGRTGLTDVLQLQAMRIAARGFVVLAPDIFSGRFIDPPPIRHDYVLEDDVDKGLDMLLRLPDISTKKVCLVSQTRGGYITLKVAVTKKRQLKDVVCYVSWYPHLQDPNAPEPLQVYSFAPEVNDLKIPVLIFVGEKEQYQRLRVIKSSVSALQELGRPVRLIIYPGVGRGFEFRPQRFRTFADDLASKDALIRMTRFINKHLRRHRK